MLAFELLQVSIGSRHRLSIVPSETEWNELFLFAGKHSLVGILLAGIERLPEEQLPKQELVLEWLGQAEFLKALNKRVDSQCVELQSFFDNNGIRSSILKGQSVALYYGSLSSLRTPGDIDIYVDCGISKIYQLARSLGQKKIEWDYKHLHLNIFNDIQVEVHYRPEILLNLRKNCILQKWFAEQIVREEIFKQNGVFISPSVEFNSVYILVHIYRHFFYEGIGFKQLMDYFFVLKSLPVESSQYSPYETFCSLGIQRFASGVMWIMKTVFGLEECFILCSPNEQEGKYILKNVIDGGNFGRFNERKHPKNNGKIFTVLRIICNNINLFSHYHSELFWVPIYFLRHKIWKICQSKIISN